MEQLQGMLGVMCKYHYTPAIYICSFYPCSKIPLCELCFHTHFTIHDQAQGIFASITEEIKAHSENIRRQIMIYERMNDEIAKVENGERFIDKSQPIIKQFYCLLNDLEVFEAEFTYAKKFINKLSVEANKDLSPTEQFFKDIKGFKDQFNKYTESYKKLVASYFFLFTTHDPSKVLAFIDYSTKELCLVHLTFKVSKSISLKSLGLTSYLGNTIVGGPTLERLDNKIFFLGGFKLPVALNDVVVLTFSQGTYLVTKLSCLLHARYDISTTILKKNFLYAVTGTTFDNGVTERHVKFVERYDISADKWTEVAPVLVSRSVPGLCSFNDRYIYIYGGQSEARAGLERYDALDDEKGWMKCELNKEILRSLGEPDAAILVPASNEHILILTLEGNSMLNVAKKEIKGKNIPTLKLENSTELYFLKYYKAKHMAYVPYPKQKKIKALDMFTLLEKTMIFV
eukprot:TRINITY_DN1655_c0_g1_i1.p1 TRINITY_DN1655_c0_g1~~TRINITY_DN1655_c0_g1_i1.p1  ORF type:complete len:457 (-),score=110.88 TRINITY_DN1655_c0_g1_i1:145-1515(-)